MPRNGTWANRGTDHRAAQAARFAAADSDGKRLAASFAMFRSAVALLARRRPPPRTPKNAHKDVSARLVSEATQYLKNLAEAIDRGDYDTPRM